MDWAQRFVAAGYAVLFPDSFTARGVREICTSTSRSIFPKDRADDAAAAGEWLGSQPFVDKSRLGLMGWSHGAMSVLWAVRPGFLGAPPRFKTAIAFYPGCRQIARLEDWRPSIPLTVLIGAADDWTRPGPCRELARTHRLPLHRVRRRLSRLRRTRGAGARAPGAGRGEGRRGPRRHRCSRPQCRHRGGDENLPRSAAGSVMPRPQTAPLLPRGLLIG